MDGRVDPGRVTVLRDGPPGPGPVLYWMRRDQRARDNWALLHAQDLALALGRPLGVFFCLAPGYLGATRRAYDFMLKGLRQTAADLAAKGVPFFLSAGEPGPTAVRFARKMKAARVVCDFSPLRPPLDWTRIFLSGTTLPVDEVDAHNVAPCRFVSPKQEFAAYTIRPKIRRLLTRFLVDFPKLRKHPHAWPKAGSEAAPAIDWRKVEAGLKCDASVGPSPMVRPGPRAAEKTLATFVGDRLDRYDTARNDPNLGGQSGLSPYFHFGQLAPQRAALAAAQSGAAPDSVAAFSEELIVRRELSDNFCLHNPRYDSVEGFPLWARRTLDEHRGDPREHLYTPEQFEQAQTHDPLWNAAQREMTLTGKMHGYLRMYWAKKILEWSPAPEEALAEALRLNDRYELDGRDPNGYAGVAWSIGGVHDRAWGERPVFGKIRYMNDKGCRRKFKVDQYVNAVRHLEERRERA